MFQVSFTRLWASQGLQGKVASPCSICKQTGPCIRLKTFVISIVVSKTQNERAQFMNNHQSCSDDSILLCIIIVFLAMPSGGCERSLWCRSLSAQKVKSWSSWNFDTSHREKKSFLRMFQDVNVLELIGRRIRNISKQWAILSLILNPLWRQTFGLGEPQSSDLHRMFFCFLPHAQRLAISKTNITAIPVSMLYSCCISRPNHFDAPQHL